MKESVITFLPKVRICDNAMTLIQCEVKDEITGKKFLLSFTKSSQLFAKVWNLQVHRESFTLPVKWSDQSLNRVRVTDGKQFKKSHPELFI